MRIDSVVSLFDLELVTTLLQFWEQQVRLPVCDDRDMFVLDTEIF